MHKAIFLIHLFSYIYISLMGCFHISISMKKIVFIYLLYIIFHHGSCRIQYNMWWNRVKSGLCIISFITSRAYNRGLKHQHLRMFQSMRAKCELSCSYGSSKINYPPPSWYQYQLMYLWTECWQIKLILWCGIFHNCIVEENKLCHIQRHCGNICGETFRKFL